MIYHVPSELPTLTPILVQANIKLLAAQNNDKHITVHFHTAHNTLQPVTCMRTVQFETVPPPATANAAHV